MQIAKPIERSSTSDAVASALRAMVVDGVLPEGERINEVHLARQLGVSRTPLREALNRLIAEGAVSRTPNLGYSVKPLSPEEFEPLYGMRPILEPAALALAGLPSPEMLARLQQINERIETARNPERALDLDDSWHNELISGCPNPLLLDLITQYMRLTRRYEIALLRERREILAAGMNHRAILAALRKRDLAAACDALRHNLTRGAMPIAAWLKERSARGLRK